MDGGGRRERIFGVHAQAAAKATADEDDDKKDYSDSNYDEFSGYSGSLFGSATPYEQDDREADNVWSSIDEMMEARRSRAREVRRNAELSKMRQERPKIQATFSDLKNELKNVSEDEWAAIPDIGDNSLRYKTKEQR